MGKILIIASVAVTLLTAVLGFVNKGKLSTAQNDLVAANQKVTDAATKLTKSTADLTAAKKNLDSALADKDQLTTQLTTAQNDATAAKKDLSDAQAQVTTLKADGEKATADLAAANARIAELTTSGTGTTPAVSPQVQELTTELEEAKTLITKLQSDSDSKNKELAIYKEKDAQHTAVLLKQGTEGRILAVNPAWNFVVLSLGDKNGVASNTELLVKRGSQLVGKIRVTSVEPSTSIADIVSSSVPHGTTISPGDHVIYQASKE